MTRAERLLQRLKRHFHDFLNSEFRIRGLQTRNNNQQVSLSICGARPAPSKKVRVELPNDVFYGDTRCRPMRIDLLNENVIDLAAYELDEIRVATGHVDDHSD